MLTAMESREQYDRELLEEYSRPLDRQPAPVFVGRQDILELIQANCRGAMRALGRNQRAAGHTIVLQGAPGAGKTAILSHLEEEWDGKPDRPHVLEIRQAYLEDPATMALAIVRKLDPSKASPENIAFSLLKELLPPQDWKHPLCILVDEIQNVRESHGVSPDSPPPRNSPPPHRPYLRRAGQFHRLPRPGRRQPPANRQRPHTGTPRLRGGA